MGFWWLLMLVPISGGAWSHGKQYLPPLWAITGFIKQYGSDAQRA